MSKSADCNRSIGVSRPRATRRTLRPRGLQPPTDPAVARPLGGTLRRAPPAFPAACPVALGRTCFRSSRRSVRNTQRFRATSGLASCRPAARGENPRFLRPRPARPCVGILATFPTLCRFCLAPAPRNSFRDCRYRTPRCATVLLARRRAKYLTSTLGTARRPGTLHPRKRPRIRLGSTGLLQRLRRRSQPRRPRRCSGSLHQNRG